MTERSPQALSVGAHARPDGHALATYRWGYPGGQSHQARAVVYLAHGMAEHARRYERFAHMLNQHGYLVYSHDHRGHGATAANNGAPLGHVADHGGWALLVGDLKARLAEVTSAHRGLPVVLLGHSMGSFLAREVAIELGQPAREQARQPARTHETTADQSTPPTAYVFMGTGGPSGLLPLGARAATLVGRLRGWSAPSELLHRLIFGPYNHAFTPTRTHHDWLSRDNAQVDAYNADPECGFTCSPAFFRDLMVGLQQVNDPGRVAHMNPLTPQLFVSGDRDGVAGPAARGVRTAAELSRQGGVIDVTCRVYRGARHELLHETNRAQVMGAIVDWLDAKLAVP